MKRLRAAGVLCLTLLVAGATCVDTEPGLAVTLQSASITVEGMDDSQVVGAELQMRLHVGKHALAGRDAITIEDVELFAGESPVARLTADRPEGFDESLEPGQTRTFAVTAASPDGTFLDARDTLCGGSVEVQVNLVWSAEVQTDDPEMPIMREMGQSDTATMDVSCR